MQLRKVAWIGLAVGAALAALGIALFSWTSDPAFAQLVLTGAPLAFGSAVGLLLAWLLPAGPERSVRRWGVVLVGAGLILALPVVLFFLYKDPMILIFAMQFLAVYGVVAAVVMWRRADSRLEMPPAA